MSRHRPLQRLLAAHRILLSRLFAAGFLGVILLSVSRQEGSWVEDALFAGGLMLAAVGALGRAWCALYIAGLKNRQLVTEGPYSMTRNPLYLFSAIGFVGVGMASESLSIPLAFVAAFALLYPGVIRKEEQTLSRAFGPAFDAYCAATPRFFPDFQQFREPASYQLDPRRFREALGEVVWFVWAVALLELVEALHEHGVLPVLFTRF